METKTMGLLFEKFEGELYDCFSDLLEEFKIQGQELWSNLTYVLERSGKMNIEYGYNNVSQISSVEKQEKWKETYLTNN